MNFFSNVTDFFSKLPSIKLKITDFLDVALVAFVVYNGIKLIRETRAFQLVKGLLFLGAAYLIIWQLGMEASVYIFRLIFQNIFIVIIIIFQQEIRQVIEKVGKSRFTALGSLLKGNQAEAEAVNAAITEIGKAVQIMSDAKTGSLIVMEKETLLGDIIKTGTSLDAKISSELICNLFYPKSPLHDGAAVIRNGRLLCAGCVLPLTKNESLSNELGTRHRAAIGMSEQSDAMVVATSEETGIISLAVGGSLQRNLTEAELRERLISHLINSASARIKAADGKTFKKTAREIFRKIFKGRKNEKTP